MALFYNTYLFLFARKIGLNELVNVNFERFVSSAFYATKYVEFSK